MFEANGTRDEPVAVRVVGVELRARHGQHTEVLHRLEVHLAARDGDDVRRYDVMRAWARFSRTVEPAATLADITPCPTAARRRRACRPGARP